MKTDDPTGAHLVGSLPFSSAGESLRTAGCRLGRHLKRIPDGDTAKPPPWNSWTTAAYSRTDGLELVDPAGRTFRHTRDAATITIARAGFADPARESWEVLATLKDKGVVPWPCRLQVGLPALLMPMFVLLEAESRPLLESAQLEHLRLEIAELSEALPHDGLAVQWDASVELDVFVGHYPAWFEDVQAGVVERLTACLDLVPADIQTGISLCPKGGSHLHASELPDAHAVAALTEAVTAAASRPLDWVHVAVPAEADAAAWVEPLAELAARPATDLYLGLVQVTDDLSAARVRVDAIDGALASFGVSTSCGLGAVTRQRAVELLEILRELSEPLDG